jgi:hypothetical protein
METATIPRHPPTIGAPTTLERLKSDPGYQAFWLLRIGFAVLPILFGLDKFSNTLVDWEIYLASWINDIVPGNATDAMHLVGVIEIVAGIAVAVAPWFGALRPGFRRNGHPFRFKERANGAAVRSLRGRARPGIPARVVAAVRAA